MFNIFFIVIYSLFVKKSLDFCFVKNIFDIEINLNYDVL